MRYSRKEMDEQYLQGKRDGFHDGLFVGMIVGAAIVMLVAWVIR